MISCYHPYFVRSPSTNYMEVSPCSCTAQQQAAWIRIIIRILLNDLAAENRLDHAGLRDAALKEPLQYVTGPAYRTINTKFLQIGNGYIYPLCTALSDSALSPALRGAQNVAAAIDSIRGGPCRASHGFSRHPLPCCLQNILLIALTCGNGSSANCRTLLFCRTYHDIIFACIPTRICFFLCVADWHGLSPFRGGPGYWAFFSTFTMIIPQESIHVNVHNSTNICTLICIFCHPAKYTLMCYNSYCQFSKEQHRRRWTGNSKNAYKSWNGCGSSRPEVRRCKAPSRRSSPNKNEKEPTQ